MTVTHVGILSGLESTERAKNKDDERAKNMVELAVLCANLDKDGAWMGLRVTKGLANW